MTNACCIFSDDLTGCGRAYWTAGQRIDPSSNSEFIWRVKSTDADKETVSLMSYTNWYRGEPNYTHQRESCMHLYRHRTTGYQWNDYQCSRELCAVCELDI